MGTDEMNDLEVLRLRVRCLEKELQERDAAISRVAEALRNAPVYRTEAYRLLDLIHHLLPAAA